MFWTQVYDLVIGSGVLALQAAIVFTLLLFIISKITHTKISILEWLGKHAVGIGFVLSLFATVGSLLYSNLIGLDPCLFCWWARIFMFSQVIIFGLALVLKHTTRPVVHYMLGLSLIGVGLSVYHYLVQRVEVVSSTCGTTGQSASCGGTLVDVFGYISIPMMSGTIFLALIVIGLLYLDVTGDTKKN